MQNVFSTDSAVAFQFGLAQSYGLVATKSSVIGIRFETFTRPTLSNTEEEKQIEGATQTTVLSTTFVTIKDLRGRSTRELP